MKGTAWTALFGVLTCTVVTLFLVFMSPEASGGYVDGDWNITSDTTIVNETWTINGSVTISAGTLYLKGAELVLAYNDNVGGDLVIEEGGTLVSEESVIRSDYWHHRLVIYGGMSARDTTIFRDGGHGWKDNLYIFQYNGTLVLDRCDLYCYIRTCRNATVTDCTIHVDSTGISVSQDSPVPGARRVLVNNTTFHGGFQSRGIWVWGPYPSLMDIIVNVRNCTFYNLTWAISVINFLDNGMVIIEDNRVYGSSIGADLSNVGSSVVCRRNVWEAGWGMDIDACGVGSPNISDETIHASYYGIRISSWPTPTWMSNVSITSDQTAIWKSGEALIIDNCSLNGTVNDIEVRSGGVLAYDCSHSYRIRMIGDRSFYYDYRSIEIASVGWKDGPIITEGVTWFYNDHNETVASMSNDALTTLVVKHLHVTFYEELRCDEFYCGCEVDDRTFWTGRYPVLGIAPVEIAFVDDSPPTLSIRSPKPGSFHNSSYFVVEGTCEERGSGIHYIRGGLGDGPWKNATIVGSDTWTVVLGPLPDGVFSIMVNITDLVGNAGSGIVVNVTVDTVPPVIDVIEPRPWTNIMNPDLVVQTEVGSVAFVNLVKVEVSPLGIFTHELHLTPGVQSIHIRVEDLAGNVNETLYSIDLDMTPPSLVVVFPVDGGWIGTVPFEVQGYSEEDAVVIVGDIEAARSGTAFSLEYSAHEGPIVITIFAKDRAGNTAYADVSATVDLTPPELYVEEPFEDLNTTISPLTISGLASDNYIVRVMVDGTEVQVRGRAWSHNLDLMIGRQRIDIKAEDGAGHSVVIVRYVVYDPIPPSMSVALELGGDTFQDPSEEILTSDTKCKLVVTLDEECDIRVASWGVFRSSRDRTTILINLTENAFNEVSIVAIDIAGNKAESVTFWITVDTRAPSLQIIEPAQGAIVQQNTILLHVKTEPGTVLQIYGKERSLGPDGEFIAEIPLWEGRNEIEVEVFDEVGNRANATLLVYYEPLEEEPVDGASYGLVAILVAIVLGVIALVLFIYWRRRDA